MTIYFNVSDAVGASPNHGITRTERKLAEVLMGRNGVEFAVAEAGDLWSVDPQTVSDRLTRPAVELAPVVERYGVTPPPRHLTKVDRVRAIARRARASADRARGHEALDLAPLDLAPGDVLVSAGLDWLHDIPAIADKAVFGLDARLIGFCYDTIPIDHPEWIFPPNPGRFVDHFGRMSRVADRMVAISQSTKRDFCRLFPEYGDDRVEVLVLGADAAVEVTDEQRRFAAGLFDGEPYAIYTATLDRRKNHHVLYRTMRELARRGVPANFLFVGMMGNGVSDLVDAMRWDRTVSGRIAHLTNCDDGHLAACYERASFAVYPSLYEGWGLGVTEALAHDKPCLIARGSSLGEAGLGVCRELHPLKTLHWCDAVEEYFVHPPTLPRVDLPSWSAAGDALVELAERTVRSA